MKKEYCDYYVLARSMEAEGNLKRNSRMEWVVTKVPQECGTKPLQLYWTLEANAYTLPANSSLVTSCRNTWTRPFSRKTTTGFCACDIYIVIGVRNTQALPSCVLKHRLPLHHGVSSGNWIRSYTHLAQNRLRPYAPGTSRLDFMAELGLSCYWTSIRK